MVMPGLQQIDFFCTEAFTHLSNGIPNPGAKCKMQCCSFTQRLLLEYNVASVLLSMLHLSQPRETGGQHPALAL